MCRHGLASFLQYLILSEPYCVSFISRLCSLFDICSTAVRVCVLYVSYIVLDSTYMYCMQRGHYITAYPGNAVFNLTGSLHGGKLVELEPTYAGELASRPHSCKLRVSLDF